MQKLKGVKLVLPKQRERLTQTIETYVQSTLRQLDVTPYL